jgi:hypothetical protein
MKRLIRRQKQQGYEGHAQQNNPPFHPETEEQNKPQARNCESGQALESAEVEPATAAVQIGEPQRA